MFEILSLFIAAYQDFRATEGFAITNGVLDGIRQFSAFGLRQQQSADPPDQGSHPEYVVRNFWLVVSDLSHRRSQNASKTGQSGTHTHR